MLKPSRAGISGKCVCRRASPCDEEIEIPRLAVGLLQHLGLADTASACDDSEPRRLQGLPLYQLQCRQFLLSVVEFHAIAVTTITVMAVTKNDFTIFWRRLSSAECNASLKSRLSPFHSFARLEINFFYRSGHPNIHLNVFVHGPFHPPFSLLGRHLEAWRTTRPPIYYQSVRVNKSLANCKASVRPPTRST